MPAKHTTRREMLKSKIGGEDTGPLFKTWAKGDAKAKEAALNESSRIAGNFDPIMRTSGFNTFENVAPNLSVRDTYSARDYHYFRRNEQTPRKHKDIIYDCMEAYRHIGIVNNVINLMADFSTQGITIVHKVPSKERFLKKWADKVKMKERSERFVNYLLRCGNVVVKRSTAKLTPTRVSDFQRTGADADYKNPPNPLNDVKSYEIPWKYTFMNPLDVEIVGDDAAAFVGVSKYILRIPDKIQRIARTAPGNDNKSLEVLMNLPPELLSLIKRGDKYIPLPDDKILVYHYKKDDWQIWADPMHFCILDDLIDYQKARLADRTALDAAASRIRIWRLGSLEHELIPTQAAFVRLNNMLMALGSGGTMDIIWGPDLSVEEISTDMQKFLGTAKYEQTLKNIYAGLGIPSSLTGGGQDAGFTNNFVSLKTLIERLNYARNILSDFWNNELRLLQAALGDGEPGTLIYDKISLTTDDAEKALLIQLADRDLISHEAIQQKFDLIPDLEAVRIKREYKRRTAGKLPEKASPYHKTGGQDDMKRIALQRGLIRPEDVGVSSTLDTKKLLMQPVNQPKGAGQGSNNPSKKPKGQNYKGRPKNSKDKSKRKQKTVKPRTKAEFASMVVWAKDAQRVISDILTPIYLKSIGKKNLRQLTSEETVAFEELKFAILANCEPQTKITEELIEVKIQSPITVPNMTRRIYASTLIEFMEKVTPDPNIEDVRNIQSVACIIGLMGEESGEG
jgi:hypothetical protein